MSGIDSLLLETNWQLYAIIPLQDKQLVSVISYNEAQKVGTALGSGIGALHCQAGQGGLAGIVVKAEPSTSGGRKKRKTLKKRRSRTKKKNRNMKGIKLKRKRNTLKKRRK